jgi:hypothetical protein
MEGKKSARSKSKQKEQSQLSEEEKSFVEHKKKKAIVKTHGIDNVRFQKFISLDIDF